MNLHNLPDLSRKRKDRDVVDENEFMHEDEFIRCINDAIERSLVSKKLASRLGIHKPLKHDSAFDLSRGRFVRPLSCLSSPRPRQVERRLVLVITTRTNTTLGAFSA